MTEGQIAAWGTSIVGPLLAYLKISSERRDTSTKRDTEHQLLCQKVQFLESKMSEMDDLKEMMHDIKLTVTEIKTTLEFFKQHMGIRSELYV